MENKTVEMVVKDLLLADKRKKKKKKPFLSPNQQRQSSEGVHVTVTIQYKTRQRVVRHLSLEHSLLTTV